MLMGRRGWLKQEDGLPEPVTTRLYVPQALAAGLPISLSPATAHRLQHVLRLGIGAIVAGFNDRDGEWLCRVDALGRSGATLQAIEQRRPAQPEPDLWLLFSPIKRARLEWLVEKATELGAAALVPVVTARTQSERLNRDRLQAIAVAAAEQCERLSVPEIRGPEPLGRLLAGWPAARCLIVCDESGSGMAIATALAGFPMEAPAALFVGPEGGFTETELDAFGKLPIVNRVGLGPRVLRAETAVLAALSVFQAIAGDWRGRRLR
jgi:16S rRNA (uracil1498-N3)-methyltransferase